MSGSRIGNVKTFFILLRELTKTDVVWIIITALELIVLWGGELSIDENHIPTIINGATSTTSILSAFTGILFSIGHLQKLELQKIKDRSFFSLLCLSFSLILIGSSYLSFVGIGDYEGAFKYSISGLIIAIGVFATFSKAWFNLNLQSSKSKISEAA